MRLVPVDNIKRIDKSQLGNAFLRVPAITCQVPDPARYKTITYNGLSREEAISSGLIPKKDVVYIVDFKIGSAEHINVVQFQNEDLHFDYVGVSEGAFGQRMARIGIALTTLKDGTYCKHKTKDGHPGAKAAFDLYSDIDFWKVRILPLDAPVFRYLGIEDLYEAEQKILDLYRPLCNTVTKSKVNRKPPPKNERAKLPFKKKI